MADLATITDASERAMIVQNPSEAEALRPPKPMFIYLGAFSGANESTRSFESIPIPRDLVGIRRLIETLQVRLQIEGLRCSDNEEFFDVDLILTGTSDEWIGTLCRCIPELTGMLDQIQELTRFLKAVRRDPAVRRQFIEWNRSTDNLD